MILEIIEAILAIIGLISILIGAGMYLAIEIQKRRI